VVAFLRGSGEIAFRETSSHDLPSVAAQQRMTSSEATPQENRTAFIPTWVNAESVEQILLVPAFRPVFMFGLILIHEKLPAADRFVSLATDVLWDLVSFKKSRLSASKVEDLIPKPGARASRARRPRVLILDADGSPDDIARIVAAYAVSRGRRGLWVRCHPDYLLPMTLRWFDALFMFDMAGCHFDRLRSTVRMPSGIGERLRDTVSSDGSGSEGVLVLMVSDVIRGLSLPKLRLNPVIVPMRKTETLSETL
jgi:hypothetical protein